MKAQLTIGGKTITADLSKPLDISIPVQFDGGGLQAFGADAATHTPFTAGNYVGDVRKGGSCNCDVLTFAPHLHGTHTECVGHISHDRIHIADMFSGGLLPATVVTITPVAPSDTDDTYHPGMQPGDLVITQQALADALDNVDSTFLTALVVRTGTQQTAGNMPPYFTNTAMEWVVDKGIGHLLIDTPSVDRLDDDGHLSNHHIFWGTPQGSHDVDKTNPSPKTITELISVPTTIDDGRYILNLQVAAMNMDAAPSRPLLHKVEIHD